MSYDTANQGTFYFPLCPSAKGVGLSKVGRGGSRFVGRTPVLARGGVNLVSLRSMYIFKGLPALSFIHQTQRGCYARNG